MFHCDVCSVALGEILVYVDGMNAVMAYNDVVQWLYELLESKVSI